jgi:hypothetical protein
VNLPIAICFTYTAGIVAALCSRAELRGSPRPSLTTSGFRAFLAYTLLLLIPSTVYFYAFHGDWFLLYLLDSTTIPSAIALLLFVLQAIVGSIGFATGAHLVRMQREHLGLALAILTLGLGAGIVALLRERYVTVGSFAQFHGTFGLKAWMVTPLLPATVLFATLATVGLVHCCVRTHWGARRTATGS